VGTRVSVHPLGERATEHPPWDELGTALGVDWSSSGANYAFGETATRVAVCRVWRRPDLSSADGARCAEEMGELFRRAGARGDLLGQLFDLRDGPRIAGPRTDKTLGQMFSTWELAKKPLAVVVSDDPMQRLQMKRLIEGHASKYGLATPSFAEAKNHVGA